MGLSIAAFMILGRICMDAARAVVSDDAIMVLWIVLGFMCWGIAVACGIYCIMLAIDEWNARMGR